MFAQDSSGKRLKAWFWRCVFVLFSAERLQIALGVFLILAALFVLSGCSIMPQKPIVQTVVVEKPVQVLCKIPAIERPAWETERANSSDPVTVSRAIRAELEQRRSYEAQLEGAQQVCQ